MRKKIGNSLIILGVLMFLGSGFLVWQNFRETKQAETESQVAMESLIAVIPTQPPQETVPPDAIPLPTEPLDEDYIEYPDYVLNPDMDMPEYEINGIAYIGELDIEDLQLRLPVISQTTDRNLKKAPCRYSGSAYLDNLVIGAHNYNIHFGGIGNLSYGSIITFTDMDGNVFTYQVADIEILQPSDVEALCSGEWPLTLYTCTLGGRTRVTVRCDRIEDTESI